MLVTGASVLRRWVWWSLAFRWYLYDHSGAAVGCGDGVMVAWWQVSMDRCMTAVGLLFLHAAWQHLAR